VSSIATAAGKGAGAFSHDMTGSSPSTAGGSDQLALSFIDRQAALDEELAHAKKTRARKLWKKVSRCVTAENGCCVRVLGALTAADCDTVRAANGLTHAVCWCGCLQVQGVCRMMAKPRTLAA
jgi:hypothetical protein